MMDQTGGPRIAGATLGRRRWLKNGSIWLLPLRRWVPPPQVPVLADASTGSAEGSIEWAGAGMEGPSAFDAIEVGEYSHRFPPPRCAILGA